MSYQQLLIRNALSGDPAKKFMKPDPVTIAPSLSVQELVEDYFYKYHYKMFPVSENGRLAGCVTTKAIKEIPRDQWNRYKVQDITQPCSEDNTISADSDAMKAISVMNKSGNSRLMVVEDDKLAGVITLKDMLDFLALKIDLED